MNGEDQELEALLGELSPEARQEVLEAHRLLEHDLARLVDPLPPADFLQGVMAKVEAAPARAPSRTDVVLAAVIVVSSAAAGLGALSSSGLGLVLSRTFLALRGVLVGMAAGLEALWRTAALPVSIGLVAVLMVSLVALRRLVVPQLATQGAR